MRTLPADTANLLLVICDLRMPEVDGKQICARLREADPQCPLILLTAYVSEDTKAKAHRIGVQKIVRKPFAPAEFMEDIRRLVMERRRGWQASENIHSGI